MRPWRPPGRRYFLLPQRQFEFNSFMAVKGFSLPALKILIITLRPPIADIAGERKTLTPN